MSWYIDQGPDSDVFVSSRIRLARNLDRVPFPHRMDSQQAREAADSIVASFSQDDANRRHDYLMIDLETLSDQDRQALAEKRLISDDLARKGHQHRVIISRDESVSIMVNEEDHIRIQSMQAGFDLEKAFEAARQVAMQLENSLTLAYSEKYGFLTACPTNTGTGMRASVMAHLPGLVLAGWIKDTVDGLSKLGFAVRGTYGEHSKSQGNLFQISNQLTLGISEDDLINDLKRMLLQLMEQERKARRAIYNKQPIVLEDRIMRAYGILHQARLIAHEEAATLLSDLRLGVALGLVQNLRESDINHIQSAIGPASIQKANGREMKPEERDSVRASLIRSLLPA